MREIKSKHYASNLRAFVPTSKEEQEYLPNILSNGSKLKDTLIKFNEKFKIKSFMFQNDYYDSETNQMLNVLLIEDRMCPSVIEYIVYKRIPLEIKYQK